MSISEKAMLVRLSISQWTAHKHDKRATATVEQTYNTHKSGRFNKALIAQEAIKEVGKAANTARTFHYKNTLPWTDDGFRLLPAANFTPYTEGMRKHHSAFGKAVTEFTQNYPSLVQDAKAQLNGLFQPEDYPVDIKQYFNLSTEIIPVPTQEDFRVTLREEETASIRQDIEERTQAAGKTAHLDLYHRLAEAIGHMADKLSTEDAVFRDSLITNLCELCDLIPRLNIDEDPELERLRQGVERKLCSQSPSSLRDNKSLRKQTAEEASAILSAMGGIYGR